MRTTWSPRPDTRDNVQRDEQAGRCARPRAPSPGREDNAIVSTPPVTYRLEGKVAVVALDDGKANAFSFAVIEGMSEALDRALADEAGALVFAGRPGKFSAGFDLSVMMESASARRNLVEKGARLMLRLCDFPRPVVAAVTGHALAAGAVLLTAVDLRIAADVPAKIGLNEVAIGMPLPIFAMELARERLSKRHLLEATALARIYGPREACDAGYVDEVVPAEGCVETAIARAAALAELADPAFKITKRLMHAPTMQVLRDTLEEDMDKIGPRAEAG